MKITKILTLLTILIPVLFSTFGVAYSASYPQAQSVKYIGRKRDLRIPNIPSSSPQVLPGKYTGDRPDVKGLRLYTTYIEYCLLLSMRRAKIFERHNFRMDFRVERDGRISGYTVTKLSDSIEYDRKVLQTVLNTGPFYPFPKELSRDFIAYQFHIDGADISLASYAGSPEMKHKITQNGPSKTVPISKAKMLSVTGSEASSKTYLLTMLVAKQIQANWFPPLTYNSIVGVSFKIDNSKNVWGIKIIKGEDKKAINAALYAIRSIGQLHSNSASHSHSKSVEYWFYVEDAR